MSADRSVLREPQIVLPWLVRLRWLAVIGQVGATSVAVGAIGLTLPLGVIASVALATLTSNIGVLLVLRRADPPPWLTAAVVLLDVLLLTALLFVTGGQDNPFSTLYLVHVAMAVAVLGATWTWIVVGGVAALYAFVCWRHLPLYPPSRAPAGWVLTLGNWTAVVLVAALIAYFIGRVRADLARREGELRDAREMAAKNEQLAALTTLSAGAAHELGSPLATIAVAAREIEVFAVPDDGKSSVVADAKLIRDQVDRCRAILDRMRVDHWRSDGASGSSCDLDIVLDGVLASLRAGERPRLRVELDHAPRRLPGPALVLQQAITTLIRNAFDADPRGIVTLRVEPAANAAALRVIDHGIGMDDDTRRRAGQPFFTTKPPGEGMGLGLFLVRLVADRAGGTFVLEPTPGGGTTATLSLRNRQT